MTTVRTFAFMEKKTLPKSLMWFYILVTYVIVQFAWWAYHLIGLSEKVYNNAEVNKRVYMIVGEGLVFFALLVVGVWQLKKSIRKEIELNRDQKNFLLATTHELKTPISVVKLYLETLNRQDIDEQKRHEILQTCLQENDRLNQLIDKVLLASRVESNSHEIVQHPVQFSELVNELLHKLKGPNDHTPFSTSIEPDIVVMGDRSSLESVVSNLLENAKKYSSPGSSIMVELNSSQDQYVQFVVSNQGKGIKNVQKVKELFYREDNEETRTSKGSGLGLYIVNQLVKLHDGRFDLSSQNGTTTAKVQLLKQTV